MTSLTWLEIFANLANLTSVFLAAKNQRHTWTIGIFACLLFAWLFYQVQLYADVTLMFFFIITSAIGWWQWQPGKVSADIRRTAWPQLLLFALIAVATLIGYGYLLHSTTDAYAPFADSAILAFSVLAQLLLMNHRLEAWWFWLVVNSIAVPLYAIRGLEITALVYAGFWLNAFFGLYSWRKQYAQQDAHLGA